MAKDANPPVRKPQVAQLPAKSKIQAYAEDGRKESVKRSDAILQAITPSRLRASHSSSTPAKSKLSILQAEKACEGVKGNIQRVQGKIHPTSTW